MVKAEDKEYLIELLEVKLFVTTQKWIKDNALGINMKNPLLLN